MDLDSVGDAVLGNFSDTSLSTVAELISELGKIGNWLQAIGLIAILWVLVQIIFIFYNHKKKNHLKSIEQRLNRIEEKINKLKKNKK